MASLSESVVKLQKLTQTNLDILQALNESFSTNYNHLLVNVGGTQYAIPSFLSLENKINLLQENFNNLVNAPETGEAFFAMDGNSRSIEVRSYTSVPNSLVLPSVSEFGVSNNDIFKDFMTPMPYVNVALSELPNDTVQVLMKKVVPVHSDLVSLFSTTLGQDTSKPYAYKDLYKILSQYTQDVDYVEYETKLDMPIRKNIGSGVYVIESIIKDEVDENLDNYITVKFRNDMKESIYMNSLKYRLFDETIERNLKVGDCLVTFNGNAKVEIVDIFSNTNQVRFKVLHGEYLNLIPSDTNNEGDISDLSKMKFFSPVDFDNDKYAQIPLEEDEYVFVALAPLNNRMNVQSAWGSGLMIHTYELLNGNVKFKTYYEENVRNVGDVLYEITAMMSNTLMKYGREDFDKIVKYSPVWNEKNLLVTQINKHLNDSESVKNIRSLYAQKKTLQTQLNEIQTSIAALNEELSTTSFDDVTGTRAVYLSQISDLNSQKNDLNASIMKIVDEISYSANNSEVPIENGKYRIRGFVDVQSLTSEFPIIGGHVKGIRVQYRYKTVNAEQGTALSINNENGEGNFIFSDWNNMSGFDLQRIANYDGGYKFNLEGGNDNINEPSFNQIDIPISQGETVDIRYKLVYDFGQPFVQVSSSWSPIINIAFPEEFLKDVQILDIISENNDDIETNRFKNIINEGGVTDHVGDKVTDQDVTYFHKPENIASGFYTQERRIIPLKDKLSDMNALITELYDEVKGSSSDNLSVSIKLGNSVTDLYPYQTNKISVEPYSSFSGSGARADFEGIYEVDKGVVSTVLNISIQNTSQHTVKLFSLFPGNRDTQISDLKNTKFNTGDYTTGSKKGVWFAHGDENSLIHTVTQNEGEDPNCELTNTAGKSIQCGNQFVYFRIKSAHDGTPYYGSEDKKDTNNVLSLDGDYMKWNGNEIPEADAKKNLAYMYPSVSDPYGLSLDSNMVGDHLILAPGEELIIPIIFEYYVPNSNGSISKTISFDLRTSLYNDPLNFTFQVTAKNTNSLQDKVIGSNRIKLGSKVSSLNAQYPSKFRPTVK